MATKSPRRPDGDLNGFWEPNGDQNGLLSRLVTKMPAWPNCDLIRTAIDFQSGLVAKSNGFWCYRWMFQGWCWVNFRPQIKRSIDQFRGAQEKEGHLHSKNFLRASKWGITCHTCSIIPKSLYCGLGLIPILSKGILGWWNRYGNHVIPHFKALKKCL